MLPSPDSTELRSGTTLVRRSPRSTSRCARWADSRSSCCWAGSPTRRDPVRPARSRSTLPSGRAAAAGNNTIEEEHVKRIAWCLLAAGALLAGSAVPAAAQQHQSDKTTLLSYAAATWKSMSALTDPHTALPADNIAGDLTAGSRSAYTSPTNIGAYLWSTVVADDLHLIRHSEAIGRLRATLQTLSQLDRNTSSGMFYNWYNPSTTAVLHTWPVDGSSITPFLSSVDNGWLAAALMVVRTKEPAVAAAANQILRPMDFGFYYDPVKNQLRGGFYDTQPPGCSIVGNYVHRGPDVWYTCNTYDVLNSEPRIATYIGIARGEVPAKQ